MSFENNKDPREIPHEPSIDDSKLMIDKADVIKALQKLIDEYPSTTVPRSVVRKVLLKIAGSSEFADLGDHPSIKKLDEIIHKARSV